MPEIVIFKDDTGRLCGWGEKGRRAYAKWRHIVRSLEPGEMAHFAYRLPRSGRHHRFFFARLAELFGRQETFEDADRMLDWLKVGAGHVDMLPGIDGHPVAIPRSINWASLDEQGFIEFTRAMNDFLWTPHAQAVLWPHLNEQQRHDQVQQWMDEGAR